MENKDIIREKKVNKSINSEKVIEKLLTSEVKSLGGLSLKLISIYYLGLPDRLCLLPCGYLSFIELKTTKQKPRRSQLLVHKKLRALGFDVKVIDSIEKVKAFIREYKGRYKISKSLL